MYFRFKRRGAIIKSFFLPACKFHSWAFHCRLRLRLKEAKCLKGGKSSLSITSPNQRISCPWEVNADCLVRSTLFEKPVIFVKNVYNYVLKNRFTTEINIAVSLELYFSAARSFFSPISDAHFSLFDLFCVHYISFLKVSPHKYKLLQYYFIKYRLLTVILHFTLIMVF